MIILEEQTAKDIVIANQWKAARVQVLAERRFQIPGGVTLRISAEWKLPPQPAWFFWQWQHDIVIMAQTKMGLQPLLVTILVLCAKTVAFCSFC